MFCKKFSCLQKTQIYHFAALCACIVVCLGLPRALTLVPITFGLISLPLLLQKSSFQNQSWPVSKVAFVLFFAFTLISCIWSPDPEFSFHKWLKSWLLLGLGFGMLQAFTLVTPSLKETTKIFWCLFAAFLLATWFLFIEYFFHYPILKIFLQKSDGSLPVGIENEFLLNRNAVFISLLSIPLVFLLSKSLVRPFVKKCTIAVLFLSLGAMVMVAQSQTATIVLALAVVCFFLPLYRPSIIKGLAVVFAALVLFAPFIPAILYAPASHSALLNNKDGWLGKASTIQRLEVWNFMADKIAQKPFLGHGFETTRFLRSDAPMPVLGTNHIMHPHNFALQLWLEFGLVGVVLFLCAFSALYTTILAQNKSAKHFGGALFICTIAVLSVGYGLWQSWQIGMIFVLLALGIAANNTKSA